jgi:hypothetical protein
MLEILRASVLPTILSTLLAILVVFVTKGQDKKNDRGLRIFDKSREAYTAILSLIISTINTVKAQYSYELDKYALLSVTQCKQLYQDIQQYILYLTDKQVFIIDFAMKIFNYNSDWRYAYLSPGEDIGFYPADISLLEYLYSALVVNFKTQLFNNHDISDMEYKEIIFLKSCNLLQEINNRNEFNNLSSFADYDYREKSMLYVLNEYNNDKGKYIVFFEDILVRYKNRQNNTDHDAKRIADLCEYISILKR